MPMRNRLNVALATVVVVVLGIAQLAAAAPAFSPGHGHKPPHESLPPIDTGEAENCDFIADPGNPLCLLPFPDDYYTWGGR
jgi:hypothetical protein